MYVCVCVQSEAVLQVADAWKPVICAHNILAETACEGNTCANTNDMKKDGKQSLVKAPKNAMSALVLMSVFVFRAHSACDTRTIEVPKQQFTPANGHSKTAYLRERAHECMCGCEQIRCKPNQQRHQMAHGIRVSRAISLAKIARGKGINNATTAVYTSMHMAILWFAIVGAHTIAIVRLDRISVYRFIWHRMGLMILSGAWFASGGDMELVLASVQPTIDAWIDI